MSVDDEETSMTRSLLPLALMMSLSGCAAFTGGPLVEEPTNVTGTLTFINHSPNTVINVYITRCSNSTYGGRRNDRDIDPGERYVFTVSPGCWTVRVGSQREGKAEKSYKLKPGENVDIDFKLGPR